MIQKIKKLLKRIPFLIPLISWKYSERGLFKFNIINVLKEFPLYKPYSAGDYKSKSILTINTIKTIFPIINKLLMKVQNAKSKIIFIPIEAKDISVNKQSRDKLYKLFNYYGSDKSIEYCTIYTDFFSDRLSVQKVLEIGMGTNNSKVVSNMGKGGHPGASLRAFRDFLPNALINGADIDENILFSEDRIKTYKVDQTEIGSLSDLKESIGTGFDLVIDDGLHSPDANLNTLLLGLEIIKVNGLVLIEDIPMTEEHKFLWNIIINILNCDSYEVKFYKAKSSFVLAIKKLS